jgi:hypothetical protein
LVSFSHRTLAYIVAVIPGRTHRKSNWHRRSPQRPQMRESFNRKYYIYIKANVVSVCVFVTDIRGLRPGQWDERVLRTSVHPFSFFLGFCSFVCQSFRSFVFFFFNFF